MHDRSQYLLNLARHNVKAYIANPKAKAAMVTGSVVENLCDEYSDIDMSIYYEILPTEAELQLARQQNLGSERLWKFGDVSEGGLVEAYLVNGVECQFGHVTIAQMEKDLTTVLEQHKVKSPIMKVMSGTLICVPLYGESLIKLWQDRLRHFPDDLAQAMVEAYLQFFPIWKVQKHLAERDATLFYYQVLVEAIQNLLGVLSGLNRLYYSTFQFKRMGRFIEQMAVAPPNLTSRIERLFHTDPEVAANQIEGLVQEVIALVDIHMPQVDTLAVKHKLGQRQHPWQLNP